MATDLDDGVVSERARSGMQSLKQPQKGEREGGIFFGGVLRIEARVLDRGRSEAWCVWINVITFGC